MINRLAADRRGLSGWTAVALMLLAGYLAGVILLALGARSGWPAPYADPTNPWPTALQVGLGAGAFGAYWWPRRGENRSFSLLLTASLALSTIALGLASYSGCTTGQSPFWTPLTWSLNLIGGSVNADCGFPPALQTARLFGPLLLLITALGVLAALFRNQRDRLSVRFGRNLVIAVGLTTDSLGIIRRLSADRSPGTVLAVLTETGDAALVRAVRGFGGRVVSVSGTPDARALEVLLTRGRRLKVKAAYLLTADSAVNLRWVGSLRSLAAGCDRSSSTLAPRLLVRIDDPWQAEYWRRGNAYRRSASGVTWMCRRPEPVRGHGRAARRPAASRCPRSGRAGRVIPPHLVDLRRVGPAGAGGRAARRTSSASDRPPGPRRPAGGADGHPAQVAAGAIRHEAHRASVAVGTDLSVLLEHALSGARRPAVVLADEGQAPDDGSDLAVTHWHWTLFARSATTRGIAVEPVLEGLLPLG